MRPTTHRLALAWRPLRARPAAASVIVLAAISATLGGCDGDRQGLGASCDQQVDCLTELQCLSGLCAPRCDSHVQCGDGQSCSDGQCEIVFSAIGDRCSREIDCGDQQTCVLDGSDADGDGRLGATCAATGPGAVFGDTCVDDAGCRAGACALGRCTQLCAARSDCPPTTTCADLPQPLLSSAPVFGACLPDSGVIDHEILVDRPEPTIDIPVPSNARSFALVTTVDDQTVVVGASALFAPDGRLLYRQPATEDEYFDNRIRHLPGRAVATLLMPNTPRVALETGVYRARLSTRFSQGQPAPTLPRVRILYKVDDSATLDLHFVFLDLSDHPCREAWGGGTLDAATAPGIAAWRGYVAGLSGIFNAAGIDVGRVTYRDLSERADLDGVDRDRVHELFALATESTGITVFVVRSLTPVGVQALAASPVAPRTPGTLDSGVVISADALCYRSLPTFTRITAHQIATAMGLFRNREPDGIVEHVDPIDDSDGAAANLMFFGEFGGVELSEGQTEVLRHYPGLR